MNGILKELSNYAIIPVIKIDELNKAVPLAKALCDGGLPVAEITFRTACAKDAIKAITAEFPDMLVGAGTVLTPEQADSAIEAGAKFIVSPGFNPKVVSHCISRHIPVTPGCANASDMEMALEMGLDVVKFFPSENLGGIKMIKALSAPYSSLKFIPTGGINEENLLDYLSFNKILACGGSYMVNEQYIKNGEFDKITEATKNSVLKMLGFSLTHVGFNHQSPEEAKKAAEKFAFMFGFQLKTGNSSTFNSTFFEHMHTVGYGKSGHIAIGTNFIERAIFYLTKKGFDFIEESKKTNEKGETTAIYLKDELCGFAVHLVQKQV